MGMELIYRGGGLRGRETGELFQVDYRSVDQERRRLKDRLSDDRTAQDLFKGLLRKCNDRRIAPLIHAPGYAQSLRLHPIRQRSPGFLKATISLQEAGLIE